MDAEGETLADGPTDALGMDESEAVAVGEVTPPPPPPPGPQAANPAVTMERTRRALAVLFTPRLSTLNCELSTHSNLFEVERNVSFSFISRKRPESIRTQAQRTS